MNGRIRDCILDAEKTHQILDIVAESDYYGMQTFDQALVKLYRGGHGQPGRCEVGCDRSPGLRVATSTRGPASSSAGNP